MSPKFEKQDKLKCYAIKVFYGKFSRKNANKMIEIYENS